jgi:hypothetical protein
MWYGKSLGMASREIIFCGGPWIRKAWRAFLSDSSGSTKVQSTITPSDKSLWVAKLGLGRREKVTYFSIGYIEFLNSTYDLTRAAAKKIRLIKTR